MTSAVRAALTRERVLEAGLDYVDRHGLDSLSMHKLGAELGVKAMSLYHYVANKGDLLAGIVDALWAETVPPPQRPESWRQVARILAGSLREMIHRHPNAAPLLLSTRTLSEQALRIADTYRSALTAAGLPDERAVPFLRTLVSYALGQSLAEVAWTQAEPGPELPDELARIRWVSDHLPRGASDNHIRTALWFCADCATAEQYNLGLTLMIQGLDAVLSEQT